MQKEIIYRWGILPLWLLLTSTVFFRTPIPVDETRYLSVAWEMWVRGDFLVPFLNGQAYSHKPPLLFWLFQMGWGIFGVNEWWPRLVGPVCALLNLILIRKLAEKLWPIQTKIALLVPWILIATLLWTLFATATMFDILLTCNVLMAMLGLLALAQGETQKGCAYIALATGLGLLTKGPVMLLHFLPTAFLVRFWSKQPSYHRWFTHLGLAVMLGIVIAMIWAVPAAIHGGDEFAKAIFWRQTTDRTIGTEIHVRPWFWYIQFLPLVLFPWICWPRFWKKFLQTYVRQDSSLCFCLIWGGAGLLFFSLIPSKQIHYLIPLLPAFALLVARIQAQSLANVSLSYDLPLSVTFMLAGGFLVFLPDIPGLSSFKWAQTIQIRWGLSVLAIAVAVVIVTFYQRRLSVWIVSTAVVMAVFVGFIFFFQDNGLAYDLRPSALELDLLHKKGMPCAYVGNYEGQLHFLGRLRQPIKTLSASETPLWAKQHADGCLISLEKEKPADALFFQPHREYWLVFRLSGQASQIKPL